jgi:hypothetical protein
MRVPWQLEENWTVRTKIQGHLDHPQITLQMMDRHQTSLQIITLTIAVARDIPASHSNADSTVNDAVSSRNQNNARSCPVHAMYWNTFHHLILKLKSPEFLSIVRGYGIIFLA